MLEKLSRVVSAGRVIETGLRRARPSLLRELKPPRAGEIVPLLRPWPEVVASLAPDWERFDAEFEDVERTLAQRYRTTVLTFPQRFGAEALTSRTLYALVRSRKPRVVLETGVANGHTTFVLLAALARNGGGELHSTDISEGVGCLLHPEDRRNWHYHAIMGRNVRRAFAEVTASIAPIDLFYHDSDHCYHWQTFEYASVARHLAGDGLMGSDDVDNSYAFLDLCAARRQAPLLFFDNRKVTGFAQPAAG